MHKYAVLDAVMFEYQLISTERLGSPSGGVRERSLLVGPSGVERDCLTEETQCPPGNCI